MREQIRKQVGITLAFLVILLCGIAITSTSPAYAAVDTGNATSIQLNEKIQKTAIADRSKKYDETLSFMTTGNDSFYRIHFENSTFNGQLSFELYDANGMKDSQTKRSARVSNEKYLSIKLEENQMYYIRVYSISKNEEGDYYLTVDELVDDAADEGEDALTKVINEKHSGRLETTKDKDWYRFVAPENGLYVIDVWNSSSQNSMYITRYNEDLIKKEKRNISKSKKRSVGIELSKGEVCYLEFKEFSTIKEPNSLSYKFQLSSPSQVAPQKGKLKSVKSGKGNLIVKYKKIKNATRYQIGIKQKGSSKWKYYSLNKLSRKIYNLKSGKKYTVKVRGIRKVETKKCYGKWSATKTVKVK